MKYIFLLLLLFLPIFSFAQEQPREEMFKARVIEVIEQKDIADEAGNLVQQNLMLKALDGSLEDQEIFFEGINDFQILSSHVYNEGDKVIVNYSQNVDGEDIFFILDYDRSNPIIWLTIIFILSVLAIGRWKGFRSLIALALSFLVILKFIIPQILNGTNPVVISVIGAIIILIFAIYFTQGINKKAHIANLSLIISLSSIALLSFLFTKLARLSGYSEEASYLMNINEGSLNLQGLLLAGILIGTLGVLDDVIISQVSTIEQLKKANPELSNRQIYVRSLKVGIDHITSMINTLFFAYAGVSLPLLMLFTQSDISGLSFSQVMNNEFISTEIIRTLLGSIGIMFSIPIVNYLASYFLTVKRD